MDIENPYSYGLSCWAQRAKGGGMTRGRMRRFAVSCGLAMVASLLGDVARSSPVHAAEAAACAGTKWVAAWAASPQGAGGPWGPGALSGRMSAPPVDAFSNETLRQVANLHFGGEMVRVQLSNRFGAQPITFDAASVGIRKAGAALVPGSERQLSFGGDRSVTIPPGQEVVSDAAALPVEPFSDLVVSVFTAGPTGPATVHASAVQNYYTAMGNQAANPSGDGFHARGDTSHPHSSTFTTQWFFLTEIEVLAPAATRTVVALGESTTVGFYSSGDTNRRYPDVLARRLLANPATEDVALVAQAIIGNRILHDGFGPSTLNRLDREVLSHPDLDAVILMQGLNDIGQPVLLPEEVTAEEIIAGYQEIAQRVHANGAKIYIGTLTPAGDMTKPILYGRYSLPESVAKRHAVNAWIRGQDVFDGMVDLDELIRSPANPNHVNPKYDGGDNLHPNDAGYAAIAEAMPLSFFEGRSGCSATAGR